MSSQASTWAGWLLECARVPRFPLSAVHFEYHGLETVELPFGYVVLRGHGHVALIDTGYLDEGNARSMAIRTGLVGWRSPADLLAAVGTTPLEVDTILLTHLHWDHAGGLRAYPRATVMIQATEFRSWLALAARPSRFAALLDAIDPADLAVLQDLVVQGRVRLLEGDVQDVLPGIDVLALPGTHTAGSQAVVIHGPTPLVVAGDCVMSLANLVGLDGSGRYSPIDNVQGSQVRLLDAYDRLLDAASGDPTRVIAVHDVTTWDRYPAHYVADGPRIAALTSTAGTDIDRPAR